MAESSVDLVSCEACLTGRVGVCDQRPSIADGLCGPQGNVSSIIDSHLRLLVGQDSGRDSWARLVVLCGGVRVWRTVAFDERCDIARERGRRWGVAVRSSDGVHQCPAEEYKAAQNAAYKLQVAAQ